VVFRLWNFLKHGCIISVCSLVRVLHVRTCVGLLISVVWEYDLDFFIQMCRRCTLCQGQGGFLYSFL
jgi:hypothetical protein